jgi:hypothetical protein
VATKHAPHIVEVSQRTEGLAGTDARLVTMLLALALEEQRRIMLLKLIDPGFGGERVGVGVHQAEQVANVACHELIISLRVPGPLLNDRRRQGLGWALPGAGWAEAAAVAADCFAIARGARRAIGTEDGVAEDVCGEIEGLGLGGTLVLSGAKDAHGYGRGEGSRSGRDDEPDVVQTREMIWKQDEIESFRVSEMMRCCIEFRAFKCQWPYGTQAPGTCPTHQGNRQSTIR